MDRKLHTWRVDLVGDNRTQSSVDFATYWSPSHPGVADLVMASAAATATVAAKRRVVYHGVAAELIADAPAESEPAGA